MEFLNMADVRIIQPSRNIMQSAPNAEGKWHVEYNIAPKKTIDPIMGWTSTKDVSAQLEMTFHTLDEAKHYCDNNGLTYVIIKPHDRKVNIHPYADVLMRNPNL